MMDAGSVKYILETMVSGLSANLFAKVKVKHLDACIREIVMKISYNIQYEHIL